MRFLYVIGLHALGVLLLGGLMLKTAAAEGMPEEPRWALVIGNGTYASSPLSNPVNDANGIATLLKQAGFRVVHRNNASLKEMSVLIREFGDRLRDGGIGLFYYAGHGMQVKGRNYLIPVDAQIEREDEVAFHSVDVAQVLEKMDAAKNRLNMVILDACRDNPFARSFRSTAKQGLAQMDAPAGTLVAFATSPGSVASDGSGKNGLYTQHLLANMKRKDLRLEDVFKSVRSAVRKASEGRQIPWESTSLEGDFYFFPPQVQGAQPLASQEPPAPAIDGAAFELVFWDSIKSSSAVGDYNAYLTRYPQGHFAPLARERVQRLATTKPSSPVTVSLPPAPVAQLALSAPLTAPPAWVAPAAPPGAATPAAPPAAALSVVAVAPVPAHPVAGSADAKDASDMPVARNFTPGERWEWVEKEGLSKVVLRKITRTVVRNRDSLEFQFDDGARLPLGAPYLGEVDDAKPWRVWPLRVGSEWSYETKQQPDGSRYRVLNQTAKVAAFEQVTVPAGKFMAYRIEYTGWKTLYFGTSTRQVNTVWYSPDLRADVKVIHTDSGNGMSTALAEHWVRELTAFHPAMQ